MGILEYHYSSVKKNPEKSFEGGCMIVSFNAQDITNTIQKTYLT